MAEEKPKGEPARKEEVPQGVAVAKQQQTSPSGDGEGKALEKEEAKPQAKEGKKPQKEEQPKKSKRKEIIKDALGIVRIVETDIPGSKTVEAALRLIPGVSFTLGNAMARVCPFAGKKVGELSEQEIKDVEAMVQDPAKHGIPAWALNRRGDMETGADVHLTASKLEITQRMDIDRMKKIRSYKGVRHMQGLPVRGQRTRGSFRHGKTVGVSRDKLARAAAEAKKAEEEKK